MYMRKNTALRIAASGLAIGLTTVGCSPFAARPSTVSASASKPAKEAGKLYEKTGVAFREGKLAEALGHIEKAVELAPRDAGYRMVLGDLYLKNGRFLSAEQTFNDVLTLDPSNVRAGLSLALSRVAQGKTSEALRVLAGLEGHAPIADLGLAYALAGQPHRAIAMLEPAARTADADGRTRQNLALAYALAGDWQKARVTAAQDVSPADLAGRLQQWAALSKPEAPYSQVAALMGIANVVADAGQPAQLALAPEAPVVAEAPAPAAPGAPVVAQVEAPAPQQVLAEAVKVEAPAIPAAAEAQAKKAVETLVKPAVTRASLPASRPLPTFKPAVQRVSFQPPKAHASTGRFVVQIGAYKTQNQAERAWTGAQNRYGIADREPLTTIASIPGKGTFHRLSVSGFDTMADAGRLCRSIKARGGACFVRSTAGDVPVQWASRRSTPRG
jgi:Flp pilus assembly protein TadD